MARALGSAFGCVIEKRAVTVTRPAFWRLLAAVAVWMSLVSPAQGQVRAELLGRVTDALSQSVPGATVTLTEVGIRLSQTRVTDTTGTYGFVSLQPGAYQLVVELVGFRRAVREGLELHSGERLRIDVELEIGGVTESVVVTGRTPRLQTETATLGQVVPHDQVQSLPLNGRSFIQLASLAPGVARPPRSAFPRINGGRPRTNEYIFDGISVLLPEPGQLPFLPVVEEIEELTIESNSPPAEFGRFNGGVVNLTTRAGANQPGGTTFGFFRHEALNARNAFAPEGPGEPKPRFRRQQYGGVFGGPLRRDRTFFFVAYQGLSQDVARVRISTVPTLLQRQGVFTERVSGHVTTIYDPATTASLPRGAFLRQPFSGNTIPTERIDRVARNLLSRYPLPNLGGTANNYQRIGLEQQTQQQFSLRVDHRIGEGTRGFVRFVRSSDELTPVTPLPDGSGNLTSGAIGDTRIQGTHLVGSLQTAFGRALNELRVGYTRRSVDRTAGVLDQPIDLPGLLPSGVFLNTLPTFLVDGFQQLGPPVSANSDSRTDVTQVVDVLSWQRGRHFFKAGLDWRWQRLDIVQPPSPSGLFRFSTLFTDLPGQPDTGSSLASFLLGQVETFSIDVQPNVLRPRAMSHEYFVQDDWQVFDRLTLNLGLRYTLNFPSTEADDQGAVFDLETQQLEYLNRGGFPRSSRRLHKNNLGPRLGVAYRLDPRSVVRAGYGLVWIEMAGITTPFINPQFPFIQTVSRQSLDGITPAFMLADGPDVEPIEPTPDAGFGQGVFTVEPDRGSGYVQQWNVAWQRELPADFTVEVAYTGSRITRLGVPNTNLNQLTVEQLTLGLALLEQLPNPFEGEVPPSSSLGGPTISRAQLLKPFPRFTTVSAYRDNVGRSRYDGVQLRLDRPFADGVVFVSFTRSRLRDDASSVFSASVVAGPEANFPVADSFNRALEWDLSNGDIAHNLTVAGTWLIPFGTGQAHRGRGWWAVLNDWELSGVVTAQSGLPLALTQSTNFNAFAGFGTQRPNLVADPELASDERNDARWFNTEAFEVAPQFTLGSSSRNPVRGPGFRSVDLALVRRFPVGTTTFEWRIEMFNALNTRNLGVPNTVFGTPGFGSITSALDPRVVQVGLKIHF